MKKSKSKSSKVLITILLIIVIIILILLLSSCNKDKKTNKAGDFVATPTIGLASKDTADAGSNVPSVEPTETPGVSSTVEPEPTEIPTVSVTVEPTPVVTEAVTSTPTKEVKITSTPTKVVTVAPTVTKSVKPTSTPVPTKSAVVIITPTATPCKHTSVEYIYDTIEVKEQGHWEVTEAWVEEIYSDEMVCNACGYTSLDAERDGTTIGVHCINCTANGYVEIMPGYVVPAGSSYGSVKVLIETIEHPEERTWVVDVPASSTTVCVGYSCNSCGITVKY